MMQNNYTSSPQQQALVQSTENDENYTDKPPPIGPQYGVMTSSYPAGRDSKRRLLRGGKEPTGYRHHSSPAGGNRLHKTNLGGLGSMFNKLKKKKQHPSKKDGSQRVSNLLVSYSNRSTIKQCF